MSDKLLSIPEAAERLGLSRHTIRAWVQKRQIQHYKLGRRILISPESLTSFLAKRLVEPGSLAINESKPSNEDLAALGSGAVDRIESEVDTWLPQQIEKSRPTTAPEGVTVPPVTQEPCN